MRSAESPYEIWIRDMDTSSYVEPYGCSYCLYVQPAGLSHHYYKSGQSWVSSSKVAHRMCFSEAIMFLHMM
jgi:hypothetical protein